MMSRLEQIQAARSDLNKTTESLQAMKRSMQDAEKHYRRAVYHMLDADSMLSIAEDLLEREAQ